MTVGTAYLWAVAFGIGVFISLGFMLQEIIG